MQIGCRFTKESLQISTYAPLIVLGSVTGEGKQLPWRCQGLRQHLSLQTLDGWLGCFSLCFSTLPTEQASLLGARLRPPRLRDSALL